jgi:hypothetical protein
VASPTALVSPSHAAALDLAARATSARIPRVRLPSRRCPIWTNRSGFVYGVGDTIHRVAADPMTRLNARGLQRFDRKIGHSFGHAEPQRVTWVVVTWRHYEDLECRDLLHAGRAGCRYGFVALNHGLAAMAKQASASKRGRVLRLETSRVRPLRQRQFQTERTRVERAARRRWQGSKHPFMHRSAPSIWDQTAQQAQPSAPQKDVRSLIGSLLDHATA